MTFNDVTLRYNYRSDKVIDRIGELEVYPPEICRKYKIS